MGQPTRHAFRSTLPSLAFAVCLIAAPGEGTTTFAWGTNTKHVELTTLPSTQPADMGVLRINGKFVKSLEVERRINDDRHEWFTLAPPPAEVRLPAGEYGWDKIELQDGDSPRLSARGYSQPFRITAGQTITLAVGGPLKSQVHATPRGPVVDLTYSLVGMAGEAYSRQDRQSPPQFTVMQGDRQIGSGTFEYG
jgi:hypothetical protein